MKQSVIINFSVTTRLPAKHLIMPPMPSTVSLPWLAAKKFQSIWLPVSACSHGNAAAMYRFLNWLDGPSDQIWIVFTLSINKLWRIFLTKTRIHCLEWETSSDTTTAGWHSFFCHKAVPSFSSTVSSLDWIQENWRIPSNRLEWFYSPCVIHLREAWSSHDNDRHMHVLA